MDGFFASGLQYVDQYFIIISSYSYICKIIRKIDLCKKKTVLFEKKKDYSKLESDVKTNICCSYVVKISSRNRTIFVRTINLVFNLINV